jgi:hypothetical protein
MTFCFKCSFCGYVVETPVRDPAPTCNHGMAPVCGEDTEIPMDRDWKAEGVAVGRGVRVSRDGTMREQAQLFLPDNDEFKGPGDPDGTKGARQWLETHQPKEPGGRNPLLTTERRSF